MVEVKFYDEVDDSLLKFAVIIAKTNNKWVFCKHRKRNTYEVPGGHREDGESIMDSVQQNADGSYTIEVSQPKSIVLVTEKPAPPTPDKPDEPGDEIDPGFSSGAAALGIVLGTAGLGYITYAHISSLYLYYTLPGGFIPSTRQELANVLWTTAGKPDPVSTALYTDIPADAIEQQKAARWCAEQGLLSDHGETFGPDTKVTNARIIRAWNSLKKVPVTIK